MHSLVLSFFVLYKGEYMRERKEVVHELFELRSQLFFIKDIEEKKKLNENIEKIRHELAEFYLKDAKNEMKGKRK